MPTSPGPLGFITPEDRTPDQEAAHAAAQVGHVQYTLPVPQLAKGQAVRLFDFFKHPDVIADVGFEYTRIHQITGSCVWAGGTNAVMATVCAQRLVSDAPTAAFLVFSLHNYAMSRHYFGEDSPGEGSMGSTFAKSLRLEGVRDWPNTSGDEMPDFQQPDGIVVGKSAELAWSTVKNRDIPKILSVSKQHLLGSTGECRTVEDVRAMLLNGYGVSFACDCFIGSGKMVGSGAEARVMGKWDGRGGHQQSILAVEEHVNLGPIYLAQNNWPGNTYPVLPTQPVCSTWVLERDVQDAMSRFHAEVYGFGNLPWFPARPATLNFSAF